MTVSNRELFTSAGALRTLSGKDLRGIYALRLKPLLEDVQDHLEKLVDVQNDIFEDVEEDEEREAAQEEWQEALDDEVTLQHEKLPVDAIADAEISTSLLMQLEWLIDTEPRERKARG